ncbi:MAG: integration host factor subunit beta [Proteobacteria bacterium]|nr:MAG: integration host factor subunit beta [Pseudomonadota bacterium]
MNRNELVGLLISRSGLSRKEARWYIDQVFELISEGLKKDGRVELRGLGVFYLETRKQADFLNPKNGKMYLGGDIKTVLFQPSTEIR